MALWTPPGLKPRTTGATRGETREQARRRIDPDKKVRRCLECDTPFPAHMLEAFIRHVDRCGKAADPAQQAHIAAEAENIFTSHADPEEFKFVRERAASGREATKGGRAT